jgi:cytochrome c oxidase subunit 2
MGLADAVRGITYMMSGVGRVVLLAAGQNVLHPHSHAEHEINVLWWVMFIGSCIGLMLVAFLLLLGWLRRNQPTLPFGLGERGATGLVIGLGIALPIVLLSALFFWSDVFVIRSTAAPNPRSTAMTVRVVGHQWWWEIRYPGTSAVTANELHIPVDMRVQVLGTTADVIHSIWLPELNRKVDVIPGRVNRLLLAPNRTGTYEGECSEFCGLQHAHMLLFAVVQPRAQFQAWLGHESRPASSSVGDQVFLSAGCGNCHQIRGTSADGQVGPDLTHVASRMTLAAGTIPNDRAHPEQWIADPQHVKPGNKMPELHLSQQQLKALTDYLESLK